MTDARSARRRFALAAGLLASACVAPKVVQAPPPRVPVPVVAPPPPATTDWRDIPLTPGDWRYAAEAGGSAARFGRAGATADFTVRCATATRTVTLARSVATPVAAATMAITTSAGNRAFAVAPDGGAALGIAVPARDPFFDRMAFSRGRFVVAVSGTARLVIPSWPEFARVIEDCRG
ncbi:hypothetical protein [Sphingomonas profundi]|uniref:hypothetical protein n=1 Tax=Alterirhizorhabdus profundi TaxID=2681549 RepID=UPI0012E8B004|nr:hypothetical protein [Sphingomonas profundi]